jgi:hypothetical protein
MLMRELRRELAALAAGLEPRLLSTADARAALEDVTAIRNIAAHLAGKLAPRAAESAEWRRAGFASEEQWLASITGSSAGAARDVLATARRLQELDAVAEAAGRGDLSPEQLTAIVDAAAVDPGARAGPSRTRPTRRRRAELRAPPVRPRRGEVPRGSERHRV